MPLRVKYRPVHHTGSPLEICLWLKKKYYHPPWTSKIHPMATQHPQWHASYYRTMVQLDSWKKFDTRRWGSFLLPFSRACMGTTHQENYWMGQQRHRLWLRQISTFIFIFIFKKVEYFVVFVSSYYQIISSL